jgi:cell division septation protein DedD
VIKYILSDMRHNCLLSVFQLLTGLACFQTYAFESNDRWSFEFKQKYQSDYSAWGSEIAGKYRLGTTSGWHLQLGLDYFGNYYHDTLDFEHEFSDLRTAISYRWQPSYLLSYSAHIGAATALNDVETLALATGDTQGYVGASVGYKIHSKIELLAGLYHDFGVAELDPSTAFAIGFRITPGAKRPKSKRRNEQSEFDVSQVTKEFGWPNSQVQSAQGRGRPVSAEQSGLPVPTNSMAANANTSNQMKTQEVSSSIEPSESSEGDLEVSQLKGKGNDQQTQAFMKEPPMAQEVMLNAEPGKWPEVLKREPDLMSLQQVFSVQIGTFANTASIPVFLKKHKFANKDVFIKVSGRYQKLYTGLYAERASADKVFKLLQESGLEGMVVSLKVE